MIVKKYVVGAIEANCYLIYCEETKKAAIIDPGDSSTYMEDFIKNERLDVEKIILTHGHSDHIGNVIEYKEQYNAQIYAHTEEKVIINNASMNYSPQVLNRKIIFDADCYVNDGDIINVGNIEFRVIHTPGHSPGGICLFSGDILFSGDTLFRESVGRTDFPYSNGGNLFMSIKNKLFILNDDIKVYPGHMQETTIGHEKLNNPFI